MRRVLACLFAFFAILSCTRPPSVEQFVRREKMQDGRYVFTLDLSDPECNYDISFFTAVDRPLFRHVADTAFQIGVTWISMQGDKFDEKLWFPANTVKAPYRTGVVMKKPDIWTLYVQPFGEPEGMRGMGIICKRNGDGTR